MSYSNQDFVEKYRDALNDRRQVFMIGDQVCAFVAGVALGALVVFGMVA